MLINQDRRFSMVTKQIDHFYDRNNTHWNHYVEEKIRIRTGNTQFRMEDFFNVNCLIISYFKYLRDWWIWVFRLVLTNICNGPSGSLIL